MKKTLALLLALLMLAACLAGCAAKQETPAAAETTAAETSNQPVSEETYYYICPLANLEYWLAHKAGLEDACRELNVTPKFVGDDGLDVDAMCAVIETALNDPNCAGIVMQANFVQQAYEKGIPVCYQTVDGVDGSKRLCFLGTDYVEYGKIMMRQAAEATGGKGSVIYSNALSAGSAAVEDVTTGIKEEIQNWPDMKLVAELDDSSDAAVAATKVGAALLANDNVTVVIGGQSTSAIGAVTAIKEAGMLDQVKVIQNGEIYSTVAGKQYTEVYYGVKLCYDYNHGAKNAFSDDDAAAGLVIAPSFVDTGALIINKDNVDKFASFSYATR